MFNKNKTIIKSSSLDLNNYLQGTDLFNSKFIYMFRKLPSVGTHRVNTRNYRIDLLAEELYSDPLYSDLILLYNGITIADLKIDLEINLFRISDVFDLINRLTTIQSPRDYLKTIKV